MALSSRARPCSSGQNERPFQYRCALRVTVKQAIEAIGVPHIEVELILVNSRSVDFSHPVSDGDRVSVYPQFETFDVTPLLGVRERPLRRPRFIADAHLAALVRYLRMLGYDVHLDAGPVRRADRRAEREGATHGVDP